MTSLLKLSVHINNGKGKKIKYSRYDNKSVCNEDAQKRCENTRKKESLCLFIFP